MTSQSILIWRSPKPSSLVTARRARPIRRWISWVRPDCLPLAASRSVRVWVERGSMPYSAVTQPLPVLRKKGGTFSSIEAVHSTWVLPNFARQEPSAYLLTLISNVISRNWSTARPDGRILSSFILIGRFLVAADPTPGGIPPLERDRPLSE